MCTYPRRLESLCRTAAPTSLAIASEQAHPDGKRLDVVGHSKSRLAIVELDELPEPWHGCLACAVGAILGGPVPSLGAKWACMLTTQVLKTMRGVGHLVLLLDLPLPLILDFGVFGHAETVPLLAAEAQAESGIASRARLCCALALKLFGSSFRTSCEEEAPSWKTYPIIIPLRPQIGPQSTT